MQKLPAPRLSRRSYVKHRQDVILQIIIPVVVFAILIITVAFFLGSSALRGGGDVSTWAAMATIWIIIPLMGLMLAILALALGLVYLLARLTKVSPHYTGIAQQYALWFNEQVMLWTDRIIQPILKVKAWVSLFSREK